jgi:dolichyl-diphosphooligosaccharide--protein glycosyltransferase
LDEGKGWLRANWRTAVVLVLIFGLALFLRVYFVYGLAFNIPNVNCDTIYTPPYSGGSDSYYWDRALCHSFQSGRDLGLDPMLNYPLGVQNPRPPLFPWFSLLIGRILAPLFSDAWHAVLFTFLLSTGLFGALTIFPTYALGKEAFGRKAGIIAALLLAISVGHLQRSNSTNADHDAFTLFFVVSTFYFFLRSLRTMNRRRWVENWFKKDSIVAGVRGFVQENRKSVLYALLAGLCVSVIALAWQGWAYVSVILIVWFAVELFLDRFRNEDTMGTWLLFAIALAVPLALAFQWYYVRVQIRVWFDVPAYLFFAAFVLGLAFTVTRDYPWTLVIPSTLVAAAAGLGVGVFVNPTLTNAFFTGAGYFVQTKVVTTIAEDQAPGMSQIILSFGLFTFGLSLVAIAYLLWQVPRRRDPAYNIVVVWAFAAIFMAITAARFIFNASPAFAVVSGFAVDQILVRADFAGMRRTYRSLVGGSWRNAIRKSLKIRHVLATLGIVLLVLLPNVWWAVDASIPFELKTQYDREIASLLPTFLRSPGYNPASGTPFYFGAFGYSLPKATDYYPAAWEWFATQDRDQPPELRPAFLSWWDYGFEAADRGAHPTVADNFQDGYALAGQFITAQNETQAVALLVVRLLEGDIRRHRPNFSPGVEAVLRGAGLPPDVFQSVYLRPGDYINQVLSDPVRFGPWAPDMQAQNAEYIFLTNVITRRMDEERVVSLYHALRAATGWEIGYFAVDSRLFPISVQNTGIFYAPVKLSDHRVIQLPDGRVLPFEFFQILATTNRGSNIPIQFVGPGDQIQSQTIQYQPAFYNSMFYRAYIGYSPRDLGSNDTGIPGFSQALQNFAPVPSWNLTHFRVVYRSAYYNPFPDPANHTDAWRSVNYDEALRLQADIRDGVLEGVVDLSTQSTVANGVVFLRYYDGAWVNGTVRSGTTPLPGVLVTAVDELGTPHYVTTTDAFGRYSALVPFGDITITASVGGVTRTTLIGTRTLGTTRLTVTVDQAMRSPADSDGDGVPDWILARDIEVQSRSIQGAAYYDLDRNAALGPGDLRADGAVLTLTHRDFDFQRTVGVALDGSFSLNDLPPGLYTVKIALNGRTLTGIDISPSTTSATQDVSVPFSLVRGTTTSSLGGAVPSADVEFRDETNGTVIPTSSHADGSYQVGPLLAGNYSVTAVAGDLAAVPARLQASSADLVHNLTLEPSGTMTGRTNLFGTPRPYATVEFRSAADPRMVRTATADGDARYTIRLAAGEWFVSGRFYDSTILYATLGRVIVTSGVTSNFDVTFVDGVRVSGIVRGPNPSVQDPQADIAFSGLTGQLWLRTNPQGAYFAFLPAGTYDVEAFSGAGAYFASATFSGNARKDIDLVESSETVAWRVYRDANGNGALDPGEEIAGARIDLRDDQGAHVFLTTPATGEFSTRLFANRTYAGSVSAPGYGTRSIPASSPAELRGMVPFALTPVQIDVRGSVLLNGAPVVNRPIRISAVPAGGGAVAATTLSDSNGAYALSLMPGTYDLLVDENVSTSRDLRYQNLGSDRIVLAVGQTTLAYNVHIAMRHRIFGRVTLAGSPVATTIRFDGPDSRAVPVTTAGYETYLRSGTYVASGNQTIASRDYGFVSTVTVSSAANLSFALTNATRVNGRILFNAIALPGPMPITFVRTGGGVVTVATDSAGAYSTILVPGTYSVSLSATGTGTESGVTRFYRYSFSGTATVPSNQPTLSYDLATSRTLDNTTVSGVATAGGLQVSATVTFTARGGGAISAQTTANSNGVYSVSLAPGTYDVYATRTFGTVALLARITVPHASSFGRDLSLTEAFLLSGITTNAQGSPISAPITIQSSAQLDLTSDANGQYSALLPRATYTITATKGGIENGIPVTYRASNSLTLQADAVVHLRLTKVVTRSATMTWDASERRTIAAGDSVSYTIVVRNTGNVADTFLFAGSPLDWEFSFSPASVSQDFGNAATSTIVHVVIKTSPSALVDHGTVEITASSTADRSTVGSVAVLVDIERVRALSSSLDTSSAVFDGRRLEYAVLVTNTGNARETVDVSITNPDELAAVGWTVQLGTVGGPTDGTTLRNLTVEANQTIRVRLVAQSTQGSSGPTVVLHVAAADASAVSATRIFTLQLPALTPGGVVVTGPDVTQRPSLDTTFIAILAGAAVAVAMALFLTRRRR